MKNNKNSQVQLNSEETEIVQNVFYNAYETVLDSLADDFKLDKQGAEFSKNRIIIRLSELFKEEVESNY